MRLTQKKIEEIVLPLIGDEGLSLLGFLYNKENISEFDLAKKTKKDIKIIRKLLYLLYNHNLVSFNRKKDKEKGWYIYYWTLLPENIRFIYVRAKKELLEKLEHRLEEEIKDIFYICPNNCARLNFDQATDFEFHCPECGELICQDDGKQNVLDLTKQVEKTRSELDLLKEEEKVHKNKNKTKKKEVVKKVKKVKKTTKKVNPIKNTLTSKKKKRPVKKKVKKIIKKK